jgi:predicted aminopeptidase
MSIHRTNDQARDDMVGRFRVALHTVERSPSDETVGELRSAAAPIMDRLRAEYRAAGHRDGDGPAMFRWLRSKLANRDSAAARDWARETERHTPQRSVR